MNTVISKHQLRYIFFAITFTALFFAELKAENYYPNVPEDLIRYRVESLDEQMPFRYTAEVDSFINLFLTKRKADISVALRRSETYFPYIDSVLVAHNLPWKLRYLAVIESMLRPKAVSQAGATGMWQFMPATGRQYGLKVNGQIDERNDYRKSTIAAAEYLADLKDQFGDWFLAMAAYNCGPGNIRSHIRRAKGNYSYYKIQKGLPKETAEYIPKFVAFTYIMEYAPEYKLVPRRPDVVVPEFLKLNSIEHLTASIPTTIGIDGENSTETTQVLKVGFFQKIWTTCMAWFSKETKTPEESIALN